MPVVDAAPWTAVLPVKALTSAKSRLSADDARPGPDPAALALAFFEDALSAVIACERVGEVVVATSDPLVAARAVEHDARVVDDGGHPGINAAAARAAELRRQRGGVVVMVSDLPCLTSTALASILDIGDGHETSFVADADGTGTTMWLAAPGAPVTPRFGVASRAAHVAAGDVDLVARHPDRAALWTPARRDVDTTVDLEAARLLGLGPRTLAVLDLVAARIVTVVRREAEDIVAVDEDGRIHRLPWRSAAAAGLRELHPGQRIVVDGAPTPVLRLP